MTHPYVGQWINTREYRQEKTSFPPALIHSWIWVSPPSQLWWPFSTPKVRNSEFRGGKKSKEQTLNHLVWSWFKFIPLKGSFLISKVNELHPVPEPSWRTYLSLKMSVVACHWEQGKGEWILVNGRIARSILQVPGLPSKDSVSKNKQMIRIQVKTLYQHLGHFV